MVKVVINDCYGGFGLSQEAFDLYKEKGGTAKDVWEVNDNRADPILVEVVEELGSKKSSHSYAKLKVVEVPEGAQYRIGEYDGDEWIEYRDDIDWSTG
jgi:hypothetical protein